MRLILIILFLLMSKVLLAQDYDIQLSERHQRKLQQVEDSTARAELFKKYYKKDSARYVRKLTKEAIEQLKETYPGEADFLITSEEKVLKIDSQKFYNNAKDEVLEQIDLGSNEEQIISDVLLVDSATLNNADSVIAKKAFRQLKTVGFDSLGNYLEETDIAFIKHLDDIDSLTLDTLQTLAIDEVSERAERELSELDEFEELGLKKKEIKALEDRMVDVQNITSGDPKLKNELVQKAGKYISENISQVQAAQNQMTTLKKKYSYMPSSQDLSSAVKRNSLEGKTFKERVIIGGNFNFLTTKPLVLDLAPIIGYRINKLFEIGASAKFRQEFDQDLNISSNEQTKGFGFFASHAVYRKFFGYAEFERVYKPDERTILNENDRKWEDAALIGVGRRFRISKLFELQALVLVNVLHDAIDSPYNDIIIFKTSVRIIKE
ncbi:MAG: hypothetical protein ACNS60_07105 [Candidatus Cyclobacteriaceae bacterium M2_1C_046]